MGETWSIAWSHGRATVHAGAGALGRTDFRLDDGRTVNPFYEAPWLGRAEPVEPPVMTNLRGDWACLPFGHPYGADEGLTGAWAEAAGTKLDGPLTPGETIQHGYGANVDWRLVSQTGEALVIAVDYPSESPVAGLTRTIRPVPGQPAIDVSVEIHARRPCRQPFGFHPNFALRGAPGSFRIEPGRFAFGLTHPTGERGVSKAARAARFSSLGDVPLASGGSAPFDRLPFAGDTEEIVQLCGIDGSVRLLDEAERAAWTLTFDKEARSAGGATGTRESLPSLLLWMSNRGRKYDPWNGRNLCLGVEPIASAFDLGTPASVSANPIADAGVATALTLDPARPVTVGFRLSGRSL
jgi:hypothetical protein